MSSRYIPPVNESEKILQRRVADAVKAVCHSGVSRYIGFLSDREAALALACFNRLGHDGYRFWGGYEGAERTMLCVFTEPEGVEFPLCALRVTPGAGADSLTHRDYLGAVLGLGLTRDNVGDILVDARGATLYLHSRAAPLMEELDSVGRVPVTVCQAEPGDGQAPDAAEMAPAQAGRDGRASVASLRLDAVLAAALGCSRTKAAGRIERGDVQVNHIPATQPHRAVEQGDVFSIQGVGKIRLTEVGGKTRKNRTSIEFHHY